MDRKIILLNQIFLFVQIKIKKIFDR